MTMVLVLTDRTLDGDYGMARLDARETPDGRFAYSLAVLDDPAFASVHDDLAASPQEDVTWPVVVIPDDQL